MLIFLNGSSLPCVVGDGVTSIIHVSLLNAPLITPSPPLWGAEPKKKRLKKTEREDFVLNDYLKEILVGLLLGDLYGKKKGDYTLFSFKQGIIHQDYLNHLYSIFKDYTASAPKIVNNAPHPKTGKCYNSILFYTYSLPCFNELYDLFYVSPLVGKKMVPINIFYLLTPLSLAYWIADDGSWNKVGKYVTLCTESFTLEEILQLIEVLNKKFNLRCYKVKCGNGFRIIIPSYSITALQELLSAHIPPMMKHKIGL